MRPRLWLLLLIAIVSGCDVDFVAVQDSHAGYAILRSEHGTRLQASLEVSLPETGQAPVVFLGETRLQGEARDGRWWYGTDPAVDTLAPSVELEIRTDQVVVVALPFVTRNGPASRQQNGDLVLPVVYGGDAIDPHLTWQVVLVDSSGHQLITLRSRSAPLPTPIVLSNALVPPTAVAAEITASRHEQLPETPYPLNVATESVVRVPMEDEG